MSESLSICEENALIVRIQAGDSGALCELLRLYQEQLSDPMIVLFMAYVTSAAARPLWKPVNKTKIIF